MKIFTSLLLLLSVGCASAATVSVVSTISTPGGPHGDSGQVALRDSSGATLPAGMRIRVGFFVGYTSEMDATLRAPGGALNLISGQPVQFVPLGEPPVRAGYGDDTSSTNLTKLVAGSIRWATNYTNVSYVGATDDPSDDSTLANGGVARGTRLFVMVYNTGELNPNFNDPNFQYGLFSDPGFVIPESGTATTTLAIANVDTAADVFYGSIGNSLHLALIPEPSTGVLSILAAIGLIARRRR